MSESSPVDLVLEPDTPRHGRQLFAFPLAHYETIYGTKERQLKNWVKKGRLAKPPELPPMDDPAALPAWWTKHFGGNVPGKIISAAQSATTPASGAQGASVGKKIAGQNTTDAKGGTPTPPASTATVREGIANFDEMAEIDLPSAVIRMRKVLAVVQRDYEQSLSDAKCDEATITMRAGRVDKCIERLRKLEGTLDELRKSRGELIDIAAAREDLQRVHSAMATSIEGLLVDRLGVPRQGARAFCDEWFAQLRQSRFFTGTEPSAIQPQPAAA